jgi:hypothetical protein
MHHFHCDTIRFIIALGVTAAALLGMEGHAMAGVVIGLAANHLWIFID